MKKEIKPLHNCGICLHAHRGIHCVNCGAFEVGKEHYNREGKQMVRAIPMPIRVRINRLERSLGVS